MRVVLREAAEGAAVDFLDAADLVDVLEGDSLRMENLAAAASFVATSLVAVFAGRARDGRVAGGAAADNSGLNPRESTPAEIDMTGVAPNTKFVQVAASDSASFAVTEDGRVYGWGTFRVSLLPPTFPQAFSCTNHTHRALMASSASQPTLSSRESLLC